MTAVHPLFVLIHSPLVGPTTWEPVAVALRERWRSAMVAPLQDHVYSPRPYWVQHAEAVKYGLQALRPNRPVILVGHSGAGPLLPVIGARLRQPVAAYLFVDAGIPVDAASRLDLMQREDPVWAAQFEQSLRDGEVFPTWTDEDLAAIVPDAEQRRALLADLRPRDWIFFAEPIPVPGGWPDAPCAYLQFSAAYDEPARQAQAQAQGWPFRHMDAGHFHMLVEPEAVAEAMLELVRFN